MAGPWFVVGELVEEVPLAHLPCASCGCPWLAHRESGPAWKHLPPCSSCKTCRDYADPDQGGTTFDERERQRALPEPLAEEWEPIERYGDRWGVINVEGEGSTGPIAEFTDKADADDWLKAMQEHADEDRRLDEYHVVLLVRERAGPFGERDYFWNSYEEAPPR